MNVHPGMSKYMRQKTEPDNVATKRKMYGIIKA